MSSLLCYDSSTTPYTHPIPPAAPLALPALDNLDVLQVLTVELVIGCVVLVWEKDFLSNGTC